MTGIDGRVGLLQRLRTWARGIKREGVALWFASRDPRTPWAVRLLCVAVVAYALSPIDLVPDFIPVLGYLDDVLLLPGLMWLALRLLPPGLLAECRSRADAWLAEAGRKPRSWWGAAVILVLWLAVAVAAGRWWLSR